LERQALDSLARAALDAAFRVHNALGPGLLESAYKACLAIELEEAGLFVEVEPPVPLVYHGRKIADVGYRMDLLVARELVLEINTASSASRSVPVVSAASRQAARIADEL
jgi:GxxExxY protein